MNLMKMRFLFKHHCTIKVKKTSPLSLLDSRERKALDQIEDTHQEEETP